jgi:Zn-dependent peptidase ImmA (M78 family)
MKIWVMPKSVNVLGRKYSIKKMKNLTHNGELVLGLCHSMKREIHIEASLSNEQSLNVLTHELAHALFDEMAISQTLTDREVEIFVQAIANLCEDIIKAY